MLLCVYSAYKGNIGFFRHTLFGVPPERVTWGCMMVNTVLELADVDPQLSELASEQLNLVENDFCEFFSRAQRAGYHFSIDPEQMAALVMLLNQGLRVASHKWSKRFDQDISAVCTAYSLELDGETVTRFRMACGGLAATIRHAERCERVINDAPWTAETIDRACAALAEDFTPISDMRASADIRLVAAQNLLRRFYLEHDRAADLPVRLSA